MALVKNDNHSKTDNRAYRAYLLRCWLERSGEHSTWRFSLETFGQSRRGFASLPALLDFLCAELPFTDTQNQGDT